MLCSHFDVNEPAEELNLEYLIIDSQCMRKSLDFWYTNSKGTRDGTARGDVHFVVLQQEGKQLCINFYFHSQTHSSQVAD